MKFQIKLGHMLPVAAGLTVALYGCAQLPFSTTPPADKPQVDGRITFNNADPGNKLLLGLKRYDGANFQKLTNTTTTDTKGNYGFARLVDGKYQVFYDDQGEDVSDPTVNTVGVYNSEAVEIASASSAAASVSFDVSWDFTPTIKPEGTFRVGGADTFGFKALPAHSDAEYQILLADNDKKAVWSSNWVKTTSFTWNGKRGTAIATPTTAYTGVGRHFYQIKFQKPGTTYGKEGYYGQTKWVPFFVTR